MLQDLPPDCLRLIVGYLPTASSILDLALTSRHFYHWVTTDDYAILRDFVQNNFPSVQTAPPWRQAAIRLTSRSRAWDRRAFVARECWNLATDWKKLSSASKYGFVPVIDSYESTSLGSTFPQKEVLAHSAAGRVMIRVNRAGSYEWKEICFHDDHQPENDILDLRLLRPHQISHDGEIFVFRRANGEIAKAELPEDPELPRKLTKYTLPDIEVDCITVNKQRDPFMAACTSRQLYLYHVQLKASGAAPTTSLKLLEPGDTQSKVRAATFLSGNLLAIGRGRAPIQIYDLSATPSDNEVCNPYLTFKDYSETFRAPQQATALVGLDSVGTNSTNLLLSGWTDGIVRMYDTRSPGSAVALYQDSVDDGQIVSLLPIGHERFLAGSSQNACLKTFDLRMTGMKPYSYTNARQHSSRANRYYQAPSTTRDINIFLAPRVINRPRTWLSVSQSKSNLRQTQRYRGAVYSLSSPSPTSPTVYAGITDHVIQLDFVATDDMSRDGVIEPMLGDLKARDKNKLNFSCYERPRSGHESTDPVLLRHQMGFLGEHLQKIVPDGTWDQRWEHPRDGRPGRWERGQA
jgi:WD40 repeat protein